MKYIGKVFIKNLNVIGDQYEMEISEELFDMLLNYCSEKELHKFLNTAIQNEKFEQAEKIKQMIDKRFKNK